MDLSRILNLELAEQERRKRELFLATVAVAATYIVPLAAARVHR